MGDAHREACDPTDALSKNALSEPGMGRGVRGEGARLPAAVLESLLSKSIGEYAVKGKLVRAKETDGEAAKKQLERRHVVAKKQSPSCYEGLRATIEVGTCTMNPDDMLKSAPTIAKGVAAIGAAIPFTAIVKRMLGPAADEVAEMLRDQVRLYRYGRQLTCVEKAVKMAEDAGFQPSPVPPKILFPLLEGASLEEDDNMHTMWAALLANATNPASTDCVRPSFIAVLKQLASDEARLLNWFYAEVEERNKAIPRLSAEFKFDELSGAYRRL
jgi:hypothetical protein